MFTAHEPASWASTIPFLSDNLKKRTSSKEKQMSKEEEKENFNPFNEVLFKETIIIICCAENKRKCSFSFLTEVSNWLGDTIFFFTHHLASIKVNSYGSRDLLSFPFLLIFLLFYAAKRSVDYSVLIG